MALRAVTVLRRFLLGGSARGTLASLSPLSSLSSSSEIYGGQVSYGRHFLNEQGRVEGMRFFSSQDFSAGAYRGNVDQDSRSRNRSFSENNSPEISVEVEQSIDDDEDIEHFIEGESFKLGNEEEEDDEDEGNVEDEYIDPIEAELQAVPRKMRRFLLQKMLKMKPTEPPSMSQFKKQFQMRVVDVNRTCKVTKGGGVFGFTAFVVCGNSNGAVGFGKGKSAEVSAAIDKAYSRSIRNLHFFERFEARTLYEPIVAKYEKTKVYLWPGKEGCGMRAGSTVGGILRLAGYRDVKTKVIGSRHPHNTVKATFKALSLVQPPRELSR